MTTNRTAAADETPHTPGPWYVADSWETWPQFRGKKPRHILVHAEDVAEPSICHVASVAPEDERIQQRELANARRIVACVNACEGMDTEELEGLSLRDLIASLADAAAGRTKPLSEVRAELEATEGGSR
jgi:hypothetical protein